MQVQPLSFSWPAPRRRRPPTPRLHNTNQKIAVAEKITAKTFGQTKGNNYLCSRWN